MFRTYGNSFVSFRMSAVAECFVATQISMFQNARGSSESSERRANRVSFCTFLKIVRTKLTEASAFALNFFSTIQCSSNQMAHEWHHFVLYTILQYIGRRLILSAQSQSGSTRGLFVRFENCLHWICSLGHFVWIFRIFDRCGNIAHTIHSARSSHLASAC